MADVNNKDLDNIVTLTKSKQYDQALERHIWFHEESKISLGMGGVRLSYAITAWINLSKSYPPALEALTNIRDNDEEILLSGKGDFENFHDFSSINKGLGEENKTYELFLILDKKYPDQSRSYYNITEDLLIAHKDYEICGKYIPDPIFRYESIKRSRESLINFAKRNPKAGDFSLEKHANDHFIDKINKLIEILVAINKIDKAKEIQKSALAYFYSDKIRDAIF